MPLFELTNQKPSVSSQARNNSGPYDEGKVVTEKWDTNPIIAYAPGRLISGRGVMNKEICDGHLCMPVLVI